MAAKAEQGQDALHTIRGMDTLQSHPTLVRASARLVSVFPSFSKAFSHSDGQELVPPALFYMLTF